MANTFFTQSDFRHHFAEELVLAHSIYDRRKNTGMNDNSFAVYDFIFISDTEQKLSALGNFLSSNYQYQINKITERDEYFELTGYSNNFPVDEENLLHWALDLYCKAYEFDCKLEGYGALADENEQSFPSTETERYDEYFEQAMEAYDKGNLGMAFIHFSTAIKINPNDPDAWYSRAIVKNELHNHGSAREDYDKAIELAPDFTDAIINRAANKDEAGEYNEAIKDYTKALEIEPQNAMAYFNRGNSKFNLNDKKGACEDWYTAKDLGADYAQERIDQSCRNT